MTDNEVQPPEDDELFSEPESSFDNEMTTAIERSREFHSQIDYMKQTSFETASELRGLARAIEIDGEVETAEEVRRVADISQTVADRINEGDLHRVRQP